MATYTVTRGDTLNQIAAQNNMTLSELLELNPQFASNPDLIHPGDVITLSEPSEDDGGGEETPEVAEPQDVDWQRIAARFEMEFGYRPHAHEGIQRILRRIRVVNPEWEAAAQEYLSVYGFAPAGHKTIAGIEKDVRTALPSSEDDPSPDVPDTEPTPTPEPVDYKARVKALYPWLPENLTNMFADEWADSGDAQLALSTVRASKEYEQAFPGIKRGDGSLRMTEQEWFSTREAYSRLFQDFGLNDTLFNDRFTELMEGEVSPQELSGRLGAAYEMINNQLPEVASEFQEFYGGNGEAALFASFIDPDIGQAILDRRISVAQVAGEGTARGFDVDESFAGRLVSGGVGQEMARNFFVQAEGQLQTLDDLARRHRDPDDTFDLEEFAEANVFGDASQTRRIRRLLRAEASTFTDQLGQVRTQGGAVTGLSPR